MAYINLEYCNHCEKERHFLNGQCPECHQRKSREAMAIWQSKTTDEKLLDIHKRLIALEDDGRVEFYA